MDIRANSWTGPGGGCSRQAPGLDYVDLCLITVLSYCEGGVCVPQSLWEPLLLVGSPQKQVQGEGPDKWLFPD